MKEFLTLAAALILAAGPAAAAGLADLQAAFAQAHALVLSSPALALKAKRFGAPKKGKPVTDPQTWARLLERARQSPTSTQELQVGSVHYKISMVVIQAAVDGQKCPAESQARNALYVADAQGGAASAIYPVRMVSDCVGPARTWQLFSVDADADGSIRESALYDPLKGESAAPAKADEQTRFDAYLAAMVALFAGPAH